MTMPDAGRGPAYRSIIASAFPRKIEGSLPQWMSEPGTSVAPIGAIRWTGFRLATALLGYAALAGGNASTE
jgi:hypothetical protein